MVRPMTTPPTSSQRERAELVLHLNKAGYLRSENVAEAFLQVPRELFVPEADRARAYLDEPLPIGEGQTISAPHMVAIMSEALELRAGHSVLEIGTGSGYQAAILSQVVGSEGRVLTIEQFPVLAARARDALQQFGAANVHVMEGDGSVGYPPQAPFDRIVVTAAAPKLPPPLLDQLAPHGILLVPVGGRVCELVRARKTNTGVAQESLGPCAFVPLKGVFGHRSGLFGR